MKITFTKQQINKLLEILDLGEDAATTQLRVHIKTTYWWRKIKKRLKSHDGLCYDRLFQHLDNDQINLRWAYSHIEGPTMRDYIERSCL